MSLKFLGRHPALALHDIKQGLDPEKQVFTGRYVDLAAQREHVLLRQYALHPERFVRGIPKLRIPPPQVAINPIWKEDGTIDTASAANFPTLTAAKPNGKSMLISN
jgi:putative transposase